MPKVRKLKSSVDEYIKARDSGEGLARKVSKWTGKKGQR